MNITDLCIVFVHSSVLLVRLVRDKTLEIIKNSSAKINSKLLYVIRLQEIYNLKIPVELQETAGMLFMIILRVLYETS